MLELIVPGGEQFDEETGEFSQVAPAVLRLEHSLAALSAWESKWKVPLLTTKDRTDEMIRDYVRCMSDDPIPSDVLGRLTAENSKQLQEYLEDPHTATTFRGGESSASRAITSEEIYGWMVAYRIPFECQYWNLNRLMTLIRVCGIQQNPNKKKESRAETLNRYRSVNEKRRAETEERMRAKRNQQR